MNVKMKAIQQFEIVADLKNLKREIIEIVCYESGMSYFDLITKDRKGARSDATSFARYLICYFLYVYCKCNERELEKIVNRDKSTIRRGVEMVHGLNNLMNKDYYTTKTHLQKKINSLLNLSNKELLETDRVQLFKNKVLTIINNKRYTLKRKRPISNNSTQRKDANLLQLDYIEKEIKGIIV